jgi:regulator of sigma E protease
VGDVLKGEPAEKAGILVGDKITHINGKAVNGFGGSLDSIQESIILSKGKKIEFTVERPGAPQPLKLVSEFKTDESKWFQRSGLRQVGIAPEATKLEVAAVGKGSPGEKAGLKVDDEVVTVSGQTFKNVSSLIDHVKANGEKPIEFVVLRKGERLTLTATPRIPVPQDEKTPKHPMLAVSFNAPPYTNEGIVHPSPISQVTDSLRMMWITITSVISPDSSIGVDHLSGPVGIAKVQYAIWQMDDGWRRILSFMVLFNVNLAVLNMMPFPVLDGGHITLAILEKLRGHPVKSKPLEILQTICALALMSLMLFVTSKDIGDGFGRGGSKNKLVFPQD